MSVAAMICAGVAYAVFAASSVRLIVIDLRERRLPNRLLGPTGAVFAVLLTASAVLGGLWTDLGRAAVSGAVYGALLLTLRLLSPGAVGGGDVKLAPLVGAAAGWVGIDAAVVWAPLGIALCAGIAGVRAKARGQRDLAFGPALLVGGWCGILADLILS